MNAMPHLAQNPGATTESVPLVPPLNKFISACVVPVSHITQSLNCKSPHMVAYDKRTLPRRLHYSSNHRIDDVLLLMDDTWQADR